MHIIRTVAILAAGSILVAGCGSGGDNRTARLEAEVAALKSQATTTTEPTTTTTLAPTTTTTTLAPTTTTTVKKVVTTTTRPAPTTTTTTTIVAPWCSVRALASPAIKGTTQTIYVTSNLPGLVADVNMKAVAMDGSGNGRVNYPIQSSSGTVTVRVKFYTVPWTLNDIIDPPFPPTLATCTTSYQTLG